MDKVSQGAFFMKTDLSFIRSDLYRVMSSLFRYPNQETLDGLRQGIKDRGKGSESGNYPDISALRHELELLPGTLGNEWKDATEPEYVQLFEYNPTCPPYETFYVDNEKNKGSEILLSVLRCYQEFGLEQSADFSELGDHISLELEFMHFLSFKEGEAVENDDKDIEKYVLGQKRFIENHLRKWVPAFCDRLTKTTRLSHYKALAALTKNFILRECDHFNLLYKDLQ